MTDVSATPIDGGRRKGSLLRQDGRTQKRNAAERRFQIYGMIAVSIAVLALVFLLTSIVRNGIGAFSQTFITLDVVLAEDKLDKTGNRDRDEMAKVSTFGYAPLIAAAIEDRIAAVGSAVYVVWKDDFSDYILGGLGLTVAVQLQGTP